tara:strand:+ start:5871 stop:7289 length:1419 start_codon:yes stop_codon:yes gene_type:complete
MNKRLIDYLLSYFYFDDFIENVTIVGSLEEKKISDVADIDIVIVANQLTKDLYQQIINHAHKIDLKSIGIDLKPKLNPTFGPLKFDEEDSIVLHLMIYDVESHKQHVINSPFTCFDWERSNKYVGKKLEEIFPVIQLLVRDFKVSRRGYDDYLNDLENSTITYREYDFEGSTPILITKKFKINPQHITEFCFHIIFNTINNFIKLIEKNNIKYFGNNFLQKWSYIFPDNYKTYNKLYKTLENKKRNKQDSNKIDINQTKKFLKDFYHEVLSEHFVNNGLFVRHLETEMNDGRFLGKIHNPDILESNTANNIQIEYNKKNISKFVSSPLKRCTQSMKSLGIEEFDTSEMLLEMDYGDADGLFIEEFENKYPMIFSSWKNGKDEPFPNGENYEMVKKRLSNFLKSIKNENCFIMTHQGVIRSFVGHNLKIDTNKWFLLQIPHLDPIHYFSMNNEYYVDIDRKLLYKIFCKYIKN